jgi:protein involved in polysaccharide export with SLBB domain
MKNTPFVSLAMLLLGGMAAFAQDPKFREAERPKPAVTSSAPTTDDSRGSAERINSMDLLDDTRPLRVGDRISFRIVEDKAPVLSLNIQASGDIQAPHLGLVRAAGLTCKKLAYSMKPRLEQSYFQTATVIIALEWTPPVPGMPGSAATMDFFTVFGQVGRQGRYEILPDEEITVSAAILKAGGPTQFAKTSSVRIIRKAPAGNKEIRVNLDDVMKKGRLEKDIPIRPNDVIIIPEKWLNF